MSPLGTAVPPPPAPRRPAAFWWLAGAYALGALSLIPWLLALSIVPLPLGSRSDASWGLGMHIWPYPLILLACTFFAWRAYRRRRGVLAVVLALLPLVITAWQVSFVHHQWTHHASAIVRPHETAPGRA